MMENFSYDGINMREFMENLQCKFIITGTTGRGVMPLDTITSHISGGHGSRFIQSVFPQRTIGISFIIKLNTPSNLRHVEHEMTKILAKTEPKMLIFADQDGSYNAVLDSFSLSRDDGLFQLGEIEFLCPDPFRYKGKISLDMTVAPENVFIIRNNGNWETNPVISITTAVSTTSVFMMVNGKQIMYAPQSIIPAGTTVKIDCENKELRVNNVLKVLEVSGSFPTFVSGGNAAYTNVDCSIQISFVERDI